MDNPLTLKSGAAYQGLHLCVFALTTGRIDQDDNEAVHKDYKQSQQIVELIESGMDIESILSTMDERTRPDNYMVSQLARNMAKHKEHQSIVFCLAW